MTAKNIQLGKGWEIFDDILYKPFIILTTPSLLIYNIYRQQQQQNDGTMNL
jgi:hypothetical protein